MVRKNNHMQTWLQRLTGALTGTDPGLCALLFIVVLVLGFVLRLMDITRPFYGYHMWNEAYYVTIARNFEHSGLLNLFNYDWLGGSQLSQRHGPSPFVAWLIYFSSKVFGTSEAAARLPILILGMFSLVALFFIARELYNTETAFIAAFMAAVMPGAVFLSRQISLDSPMVAFGLASVWTLLYASRTRRYAWLVVSSLLLGMTVFIKYTGVLFVPVLAWIWLKMILRGDFSGKWLKWLLPAAYFLVAALPSMAWMAKGILASAKTATESPVSGYLLRNNEWDLVSFKWAIKATWIRMSNQIGQILWYPFVLAVALSIATFRIWGFIKQHMVVLLLILPWFIPFVYPQSWGQNDGYTYPVLYGVAIIMGLIIRQAIKLASELLQPSNLKLFYTITFLIFVVSISNIVDYQQFYRSWYTVTYSSYWLFQQPVNLITIDDPFASARIVRYLNKTNEPILADNPATLYYAKENYWTGKATWYWWGLGGERDKLKEAIKSREYTYVVFTYVPPMDMPSTLYQSGYKYVDFGVWQKVDTP